MDHILRPTVKDNTVIPIRGYDEMACSAIYRRYSALMIAMRHDPSLIDEPWFRKQKDDAYNAFFRAFSELF